MDTFNRVGYLKPVGSELWKQGANLPQLEKHVSTTFAGFPCFVQVPFQSYHNKPRLGVDRLNDKSCHRRCSFNHPKLSQKRQIYILCCWKHSPQNGTPSVVRQAQIHRKTSETEVFANIALDGQGRAEIDTGIPFLDHMLCQISSHGLLDLHIKASGDLHIDDHHTNEDIGISLGLALLKALGDKRGIQRFGHFIAPLDEALVQVVLDFSGRPFLHYGLNIPTQRVGTFDTQLVREFYSAVANSGQFTLHIRQLEGINSHHIIEASFKAFARALRMAIEYDARRLESIPSSKGSLSQDTQVLNK
ncbi:hypothetical protein GpartN1_g3772.t1 [Galdieria partita]|uniref:Imidazoleglycerol-phosphate dehydratase n=1 Tax=Galdieria partita TaxID=83374 RepID=A0A9C7UQR6_9RHOD|nr:hypothetical protein GpartN1_g3772.t1 [Galdieria partita]